MGSALGAPLADDELDPTAPGEYIGSYRLLGRLGEGGFGEVYEAEQEKPVRRRVALKLLKRGMDTRQVVARFEAERQALALMDHPNVATVYDAGESEDGRPFFVMELVEGQPITDYCRDQQLSLRQRIDVFLAVCEGVQHAHSKGLIHRDLKPSNVLVTERDEKPVPKVIDFGIAKATDQLLTAKTIYTELGRFIGTPVYMSPEQAGGTGANHDIRSDVYSLGAMLYELLTGQTPFDGERLRRAGYTEMERVLKEEDPPKPSARSREPAANSAFPPVDSRKLRGDLDWIAMRALEKDPERRYPTVVAFAKDLSRHLASQPVEAGAPSRLYRMRKFARRNKALLGTMAAVIAALLAGTVVSTWQAIRATRAEAASSRHAERARAAELEARREAAVGNAVTTFLTDKVVIATFAAAFGKSGLPDPVRIFEVVQEAHELLEGLDDQPLVQAGGYAVLGRMYLLSDFPEMGRLPSERAYDLYRSEMGPFHDKTLEAAELHLRLLLKTDHLEAARKMLARTLDPAIRALGLEHPRVTPLLDAHQVLLGLQEDHAGRAVALRTLLRVHPTAGHVWYALRDAHVANSIAALASGRNEEARLDMVEGTLFAAVFNRGGHWNETLAYTYKERDKLIAAKVAGEEWKDYMNVLNEISLDEPAGRFAIPEPAATMARAYLLSTRGRHAEAADALRGAVAARPDLHALQNSLGFYLELAGSPEAAGHYLAAALTAAAKKDLEEVRWYSANWSRVRPATAVKAAARRLPRSNAVLDSETGHVYQRLEIPLAWEDARDVCRHLGGVLATPAGAGQNELLYSRFATSHACWLGVRYSAATKTWTSADDAPLTYHAWATNEPAIPDADAGQNHAAGFGNTPQFRVFGVNYPESRHLQGWFAQPLHGLVPSRDYRDPLRNALVMFAICEWPEESSWRRSLQER